MPTFEGRFFTAEEVRDLANRLEVSDETEACPSKLPPVLEEATGKSFPPKGPDPRSIGQKLGMLVGKPVAVDNDTLMLERTADPKRGNKYKVKSLRRK